MVKNAYIHIPFCTKKCCYCSFVSYPTLEKKIKYLSALENEIQSRYGYETLETLYIGGGTPSILSPDEINRIVDLFNTDENTEITMEFNPENKILPDYHINRLSIGCQTFDDDILKLIGRRHASKDVINTVKNAKNLGYKNASLDFIYGLPNQTIEMFEDDLKLAIDLDIQHISLYGLKIDEGCYFDKHRPNNLPDNDTQADMYLKAVEILTHSGFEHYEISNFSKKGYESRHNLNYWNNNTYYGFGLSAHGYENGIRYSKTCDLNEYIKNPKEFDEYNKLTKSEQSEEEIFLGFRKVSGLNVFEINQKYNIDFEKKYKKTLEKYNNYIEKTKQGYRLNIDGILVSNNILSEFLD